MYFVFKNNRKTKLAFTTYEHARQYIRKQIRKLHPEWKYLDADYKGNFASNPLSLKGYGFTIKYVE